jgi:dienelactone hydrolase
VKVEREVTFPVGNAVLRGDLSIPPEAKGLVLFAHGSGSSRFSPRNRYVARVLNQAGFATLLMDLLTPEEERADAATGDFRFDIRLLAGRLIGAVDWVGREPSTKYLRLGCFGASTGAAAALIAAAERPDRVLAVVSRGGRPDLADDALRRVLAPTLLLVGGADRQVIALNQTAFRELMAGGNELVIVPGATHLFEEPGTLEEVARLAADWFLRHLEPQAEGGLSGRSV